LKILIIAGLLLILGARLLPRLGHFLGLNARKPFRQAKWLWSWFSGSEAEAIQAEWEYGRECAHEFAAQFPERAAASAQQLVTQVGAALEKAAAGPRRKFVFSVVAAPAVNAYALPGGFIFATGELVELCAGDRDLLAFFLGHEMGHVIRGHAREQFTANTLLNAITARVPGAGTMLREMLNAGYTRELELEADREAVRLGSAAGFDRRAGVRALTLLARISPSSELQERLRALC
jgi:predicted Zn-dependent protease